MMITEHITWAFGAIASNKLRAGLSMLGIIIGVFSIIVMLAIGQGTSSSIMDRMSSMGANLITISPGASNQTNVRSSGGWSSSSKLIDDDFVALTRKISGVKSVSPTATASKQFIYGTYNTNASIVGVTPEYQSLRSATIENGRFITDADVTNMTDSIVLGNTLATSAFGTDDPIGKEVKLQNNIYTVVGVLASSSQMNSRVFLPVSTVMAKISGTHYYSSLDVAVENTDQVTEMITTITSELNRYLGVTSTDEDDAKFTASSMSEMLSTMQEMSATMSYFLGGIAAISLLVGGIGVMNIMLVSVTERTREIGIRKAIGATSTDILLQFLTESVILSLFAGAIGIGGSFLIVSLINKFMTAVITTNSVVVAFCSVVFIGVFFGILPASKASRLRPIDALRYE